MSNGTRAAGGEQLLGTLFVALAASGWGTWTLFLRQSRLHPSWQSVLILTMIAACSLPVALLGERRAPRPVRLWWQVVLLGAINAGNFVLFFSAMDRGPLGVAVLTHYLAPVIVALAAPRLLGERLGPWTPAALAASLVGLALLVLGDGGLSGAALPAALLGGGSAFFYAGNVLVSKRLLPHFGSAELLGWHCLVSALLLGALAVLPEGVPGAGGPLPPLGAFLGKPLLGALLIGVGCASLFYLGLRRVPAQRASVLTYLEPLVAAAVGVLVWSEPLTLTGVLGGVLILAGGLAVALQPAAARAP